MLGPSAAARSANFKSAILASKAATDKELSCRAARSQALEGASEADVMAATLLENRALRASCKVWSTADFEPKSKVIGEGAFGTVYLVVKQGGREVYALKQMKKTSFQKKNHRARLYAERDILSEAASRWFVKLYSTFLDDLHVYMVMEFLQGGDLIGLLLDKERFTQEQTSFYMGEVLEAIDTVHRCGFVHRDIKPDNIVLTKDGHIKLLDFGLCTQDPASAEEFPGSLDDEGRTTRAQLSSKVGTPQYMAPEVFSGSYGKEADLWALGIMTFECLIGSVPFHAGKEQGKDARSIITRKITAHADLLPQALQRATRKGYVNLVAVSFLSQIICLKDPDPEGAQAARLTADACRQHLFFQGIDFPNIHLQKPPIVLKLSGADADDTRYFEKFPDRSLPIATALGAKKDDALEWPHYEFDSEASLLSRGPGRSS